MPTHRSALLPSDSDSPSPVHSTVPLMNETSQSNDNTSDTNTEAKASRQQTLAVDEVSWDRDPRSVDSRWRRLLWRLGVRRHCSGRKCVLSMIGVLLLLITVVLFVLWLAGVFSSAKFSPRNVIFMISDGMGPASVAMARECRGNSPLSFESLLVGSSRTYSSDSLITDSAAGATAYSCAKKTYNGAVGVDSDALPCGTLLEAAKKQLGMRTGLVVTSSLSHATPGSFSAHAVSRGMEEFIAEQQIDLGVDVMLGGGKKYYTQRSDGKDLLQVARSKGYTIVETLGQFRDVSTETNASLPLLGLFALNMMDYDIDRDPLTQPSLAEMTEKALALLSADDAENEDGDKPGFFLMIEGSRIDMAGHVNDPAGETHDIYAYEKAYEAARQFADAHGNTLIIMTSDHETGGLTLGRNPQPDANGNIGYPDYAWYPENVNRCRRSTTRTGELLVANSSLCCQPNSTTPIASAAELDSAVRDAAWTGLGIPGTNLTTEEVLGIVDSLEGAWNRPKSSSAQDLVARRLSAAVSVRANIGWTTWGHTGADVNLYGYFPEPGVDKLSVDVPGQKPWGKLAGLHNNVDIGSWVADQFGLDLGAVTNELRNFDPSQGRAENRRRAMPVGFHG